MVRGFAISCLLGLAGCATATTETRWGENATFRPGWERIRDSVKAATLDPNVWVPLAGAAVLQVDHFDRRVSDWAQERTPVFGSRQSAADWSNDLRSTAVVLNFASMLATPSGDEPAEWLANKSKGALVDLAAIGASSLTTKAIKNTSGRERPNGADDESFPSGHASSAAVNARMASFNFDALGFGPRVNRAATVGFDVLAYGTAWARVESGYHYPADTLAGIALGNFFADFFERAFLGTDLHSSFAVTPSRGGALVSWRAEF